MYTYIYSENTRHGLSDVPHLQFSRLDEAPVGHFFPTSLYAFFNLFNFRCKQQKSPTWSLLQLLSFWHSMLAAFKVTNTLSV